MSASARRYHSRVPRYVLKAEDESLMRFAGMETRGIATRARVRDISEQGVAFTHGGPDSPEEGDVLKVEFTVPGRSQIACFVTVVRVEARVDWDPDLGSRDYKLIACQFRNLPAPYTKALSQSLKTKTEPEGDSSETNSETNKVDWNQDHQSQMMKLGGLSAGLFFTLAWLAMPAHFWLSIFHSVK